MSSADLSTCHPKIIFNDLMNLLTMKTAHKEPLYPIDQAITSSTSALNQEIRKYVKIIKGRELIDSSGNENLKKTFKNVESLINGWGEDGGDTFRDELALLIPYRHLGQLVDAMPSS